MLERHHGPVESVGVRDGDLLIRGEDSGHVHVFEVPDHDTYESLVSAVERIPGP